MTLRQFLEQKESDSNQTQRNNIKRHAERQQIKSITYESVSKDDSMLNQNSNK